MRGFESILHLKQKIPLEFRDLYRSNWRRVSLQLKTTGSKITRPWLRPSLPKLDNEEINLHLGCGFINHPKFINIDALPAPHIHYVRGIDNLSIFKPNSINLIYACHCLEHFPHAKVSKVIDEWFRVLKKDGVLRLSVPDFDLLLNIYSNNSREIENIIYPLMGGQNYKFNFHMTVFNRSSLEKLLKNAGFKQVQEWYPESCDLTTFSDWSSRKLLVNEKYYPISLNLEAIK